MKASVGQKRKSLQLQSGDISVKLHEHELSQLSDMPDCVLTKCAKIAEEAGETLVQLPSQRNGIEGPRDVVHEINVLLGKEPMAWDGSLSDAAAWRKRLEYWGVDVAAFVAKRNMRLFWKMQVAAIDQRLQAAIAAASTTVVDKLIAAMTSILSDVDQLQLQDCLTKLLFVVVKEGKDINVERCMYKDWDRDGNLCMHACTNTRQYFGHLQYIMHGGDGELHDVDDAMTRHVTQDVTLPVSFCNVKLNDHVKASLSAALTADTALQNVAPEVLLVDAGIFAGYGYYFEPTPNFAWFIKVQVEPHPLEHDLPFGDIGSA